MLYLTDAVRDRHQLRERKFFSLVGVWHCTAIRRSIPDAPDETASGQLWKPIQVAISIPYDGSDSGFCRTRWVKERIGSLPSVSVAFGPAGPIHLRSPGLYVLHNNRITKRLKPRGSWRCPAERGIVKFSLQFGVQLRERRRLIMIRLSPHSPDRTANFDARPLILI